MHKERTASIKRDVSAGQKAEVKKSEALPIEERKDLPGKTESVFEVTRGAQSDNQTDTNKAEGKPDINSDDSAICQTESGKQEDRADVDSVKRRTPFQTPLENESGSTEYDSLDESLHTSDSFNFIEDHWAAGNNIHAELPVEFSVEVNASMARSSDQQKNENRTDNRNEQEASHLELARERSQQKHRKVRRDAEGGPYIQSAPQLSSLPNDKLDKRNSHDKCPQGDKTCPEKNSAFVDIEDITSIEEKKPRKNPHGKGQVQHRPGQGGVEAHDQGPSLGIPRVNLIEKRNKKFYIGETPAKQLDQSSLRSASTEYGSFQSTGGSFKTAYETSSSSLSSSLNSDKEHSESSTLSLDSSADSENGQVHLHSDRQETYSRADGSVVQETVLPISSSFVDVLCAINRLVSFTCHLCKILCPDESPPRGDYPVAVSVATDQDDVQSQSLAIKRELCQKLIQVKILAQSCFGIHGLCFPLGFQLFALVIYVVAVVILVSSIRQGDLLLLPCLLCLLLCHYFTWWLVTSYCLYNVACCSSKIQRAMVYLFWQTGTFWATVPSVGIV